MKNIAQHYLTGWFIWDLACIIPSECLLPYSDNDELFSTMDFLQIIKYIKVIKYFIFSAKIHYIQNNDIIKE